MNLDEAIQHCEEVAEEQEKLYRICPASESGLLHCDGTKDCKTLKNGKNKGCQKCADDHRQLAEWLKELKASRECIERIRIACLCPGLRGDGFEEKIVEAMNEYLYDMGKMGEE